MGSKWIQGITVLFPPSENSYNLQLSSGVCTLRERHDELKPGQRSNKEVVRTTSEKGQRKALEVFLLEKKFEEGMKLSS